MRMRLFTLLTGALLTLSGAAAAQNTPSTTAPAPAAAATPQERAQAEAAAIRARMQARVQAEAAAKNAGSAPMANAQLVYGDYACTLSAFDAAARRMSFTSKGTVQFNANGTYRYLEGGAGVGRYTYDPATKQVIWLTGYFAEHGQPKTSFSVDDKAAQLSIEFAAPAGATAPAQTWNCGCAKK